ncbi:unnamed protein product [Arctia plantaginis]|uniref:Uncharacterized protein n=1 Tax=Arctia plantaginis TaxID=874455 RepID=A0A8S0ZY72_ARCPL|nr:unnamed protein product [Arctia plantaginis]
MGSPTESSAKPVPMEENTDKKSFKSRFKLLFRKKKDKVTKAEQLKEIHDRHEPKKETKSDDSDDTDEVKRIVDKLKKVDIEDKEPQKEENIDEEEEENELGNFNIKVITVSRNERIHSHSSGDSGFSEKSENSDKSESFDKLPDSDKTDADKCNDLAEDFDKLGLDDETHKSKKLQKVLVKRGPTRNKLCVYTSRCPYPARDTDPYRQINQINTKTLTGGQVIVNQCQIPTDNLSEIDIACETIQQNSQFLQNDPEKYLEDLLEFIHEDTSKNIQNDQVDIQKSNLGMSQNKMAVLLDAEQKAQEDFLLADLEKKTIGQDEILQLLKENNYQVPQTDLTQTNPIEDIVNDSNFEKDMYNYIQTEINSMPKDDYYNAAYTYPTPPRSENERSSMSASPASFYPSNSEYTLSPERSPIYNSDYEKYQYIPSFEDEKEATDKKARERTASISSMTMKQFKDMQKEIVNCFGKKECCQVNRKTCLEMFQEHMQKLKMVERKDLCMKVAKLDIKAAYGVLHHILLSLSRGSDQEDLQYVLFSLICERVLAQDISMFTGDAGLSLLKATALRCPHRPLLTRYLVQCIRTAISTNASLAAGKDYVFHEVDALGDTLIIACARAGDRCSDVLYELVRAHADQPPLFKLHHNNADGYTALHVASSQHSAASPKLHTIHVLLEHAGFELTEGDVKGKDTALHLAVNSTNCDIQLILLMFKHVDRKEWKNLAHCPNLSSKTPLDLARLATKSTSRPNYPTEVLDFLKKCR